MGKPGPPTRSGSGIIVGVRCQVKLVNQLDTWRNAQAVPPTRAAALRFFAEIGLKAVQKGARSGRRTMT